MFASLNTWQSIISKTGENKASEIVDYWRGEGEGHIWNLLFIYLLWAPRVDLVIPGKESHELIYYV